MSIVLIRKRMNSEIAKCAEDIELFRLENFRQYLKILIG